MEVKIAVEQSESMRNFNHKSLLQCFYGAGREMGNYSYHPNSCDSVEAMKIFLGILAVLVVAVSLIVDYKWRQWMAARRRDRH
jgi:hypothetical protein